MIYPELSPITPDMADDWREHIVPVLPTTLAMSYQSLVRKVYENVEENHVALGKPYPKGSVTNAVLAMEQDGEVIISPKGAIRSNLHHSRIA